ncbi:MAG: cation:proton antiporter [Rickettsiaceae bacterium H1]|nr:cation:proton antiporter [Rickettsiaceae bacterium H1]
MSFSLIVILPLIASLLCSVFTYPRLVWLLTFLVSAVVFALSMYYLIFVYQNGAISYHMGGWQPPYGIEFKIDLLSAVFLTLISAIAFISLPFALLSVEQEIPRKKIGSFYTCFLLCLTGFFGMVISHDVFNIYVFLELSSLTSYSLIAMGNFRAANSAFEYLIIGTVGATFYLFGIGLLYMMTGTLNISDLCNKLSLISGDGVVTLGMIFVFIGLGIKTALFPFHQWLIKSYRDAPCYISAFFAATATKVAIYLMIRFTFDVFGYDANFFTGVNNVLYLLSLFAVIFGSVFALCKKSIIDILPYSSVSQIGYIILGISLNSPTSLTAALLHLMFHSIAKAGLFMVAQLERNRLSTVFILVVLGSSLIGIPFTAGFVSKWYLLLSAIYSGKILAVVVIALGSVITFLYMWKIITDFKGYNVAEKGNAIMLLSPLILTMLILLFGMFNETVFRLINLTVMKIIA